VRETTGHDVRGIGGIGPDGPDVDLIRDVIASISRNVFVALSGLNTITQTIGLTQGWNIFSCRVMPENPDMLNVVQPLIDNDVLVKVLDEAGGSVFHLPFPPPNGQWSNTIGNLLATEGYYIKVTETASFDVTGAAVETPLQIPLSTGWNIISYPCEYAQNALTAVQALIDAGVLLKVIDEAGGTIFHLPFPPPNGQWSNTIGNFNEGQGYYVKVTQNTSLTIICPTDLTENSNTGSETLETGHFLPAYSNNPFMPMHIILYPNEVLQAGDEIAVFDGDICVGAAAYDGILDNPIFIASSLDDPTTEIIDGFTTGNEMTLITWNAQSGQIAELITETLDGDQIFEGLETYTGIIQGIQTGIADHQLQGINYDFMPNPFDQNLILSIFLPSKGQLNVEVFNLMGQKMNFLFQEDLLKGTHLISLDNLQLKKGTYLVNITFTGENSNTQFTDKIIKN